MRSRFLGNIGCGLGTHWPCWVKCPQASESGLALRWFWCAFSPTAGCDTPSGTLRLITSGLGRLSGGHIPLPSKAAHLQGAAYVESKEYKNVYSTRVHSLQTNANRIRRAPFEFWTEIRVPLTRS